MPIEVAREVIDALVAAKKHEIIILSRSVRTSLQDVVFSAILLLIYLERLQQETAHLEL